MVKVVGKDPATVRENPLANGVEIVIYEVSGGSKLPMLKLTQDDAPVTEGFTGCALADVERLMVSRDWRGPGQIEHVLVEYLL